MTTKRFRTMFGPIVLSAVLTVSVAAQTNSRVVYPGAGTTLNGTLLYTTAPISNGDTVETATDEAKISADGVELELAPGTRFTLETPAQMGCGVALVSASSPFSVQVSSLVVRTNESRYKIVVGSGTATVSVLTGTATVDDHGQSASLKAGESLTRAAAPECAAAYAELPDAPSARAHNKDEQNELAFPAHKQRKHSDVPAAAGGGFGFLTDSNVADRSFWLVNGTMFSSSLAGAELTVRCIDEKACNRHLPDVPHSRAFVYGVGIPAEMGVSYLTYRLKRQRRRWWFVPAAIVTAGNAYALYHSAHWLSK